MKKYFIDCLNCGKEKSVICYPSKIRKFCSNRCSGLFFKKNNLTKINCNFCGKLFIKLSPGHFYCGNRNNKTSCSYKHSIEYRLKWREKNPRYDTEWFKKWKIKNKNHYLKYRKEWSIKNPRYSKKWRDNNLIKTRQYKKEWQKERSKNAKFRLDNRMSSNVGESLKGKKAGRTWESLVGYTLQDLIHHFEKQFDDKMNWQNYGSYWHIDHRTPKSWFKYETAEDEEFKKCWALDNLQPLEATKNLSKNNHFVSI